MTTPTATPTAPLPAAAQAAMLSLELKLAPLPIVRAVTRFVIARDRMAELQAKLESGWSGAEFDSFVSCKRTLAESRAVLAELGRVDLIESTPAGIAERYDTVSAQCSQLSRKGGSIEKLLCLQDEMRACRCQLADAGRLDLIGGA